MSDPADNETPMTTVRAIEWLIGKDIRGEICLDVNARRVFTSYLQTESESEERGRR